MDEKQFSIVDIIFSVLSFPLLNSTRSRLDCWVVMMLMTEVSSSLSSAGPHHRAVILNFTVLPTLHPEIQTIQSSRSMGGDQEPILRTSPSPAAPINFSVFEITASVLIIRTLIICYYHQAKGSKETLLNGSVRAITCRYYVRYT